MTHVVGITMGDPAGIGPELVAKASAEAWPARLRVYGDRGVLERAGAKLGAVELVEVTHLAALPPGQASDAGARAQLAYLDAAIADAQRGEIAALCTAPIHKALCKAAGLAFPGHTELLAARLGAASVTMMLAGPRLRVALATTHLSLRNAIAALDPSQITRAIVQTANALPKLYGVARPRIAIAGLNPHAGEAGHFGDEETRIVAPAIEAARAQLGDTATLVGPAVPDAVFRDAVDGRHDAVVALYHDQGLIPVKLVDFEEAVNVTLGLPLVRTSPDHGVAYDIAGTGRARTTSFFAALRLAAEAAMR